MTWISKELQKKRREAIKDHYDRFGITETDISKFTTIILETYPKKGLIRGKSFGELFEIDCSGRLYRLTIFDKQIRFGNLYAAAEYVYQRTVQFNARFKLAPIENERTRRCNDEGNRKRREPISLDCGISPVFYAQNVLPVLSVLGVV